MDATNLALQRTHHSDAFAGLLRNRAIIKRTSVELMTALTQELAADAKRPQPLIDLNHKLADGGTLLTLLFKTLNQHTVVDACASGEAAVKTREVNSLFKAQLPYLSVLMRAYDMQLSRGDESALSILCNRTHPQSVSCWAYCLAQALLQAGANVNCRDSAGWTPLLSWVWRVESACGPLLLLRHGADTRAQSVGRGWTALHLLVDSTRKHKEKMLPALRQLASSGYLAQADFTLRECHNQTALQMARALATERPEDEAALELLETLYAHSELSLTRKSQSAAGASSAAAGAPVVADSLTLSLQRIECSIRVAMLLHNPFKMSSLEMMRALAQELAEDAKRPQPLIDLNHKLAGGGTLLTLLIDQLCEHTLWQSDMYFRIASTAAKQLKVHTTSILEAQLPHVLSLVRVSDVSLLSQDGETPLALLCRRSVPHHTAAWTYRIAEALLQAGVDANARCKKLSFRNKFGQAPLHAWILGATESVCGALLLLRYGADINAECVYGGTILHLLVYCEPVRGGVMLPGLRGLAESGYLALADFTLLDNAGQTALQMAHALVTERPQDDAAAKVMQTLHAQSSMWTARIRPWIFRLLSHACLVPDVVDNRGDTAVQLAQASADREPEYAAALEVLSTLQAQSSMWREQIRPAALSLLSNASLLPDLAEIVLAYVDGVQRPSEKQAAAALNSFQTASSVSGASSMIS